MFKANTGKKHILYLPIFVYFDEVFWTLCALRHYGLLAHCIIKYPFGLWSIAPPLISFLPFTFAFWLPVKQLPLRILICFHNLIHLISFGKKYCPLSLARVWVSVERTVYFKCLYSISCVCVWLCALILILKIWFDHVCLKKFLTIGSNWPINQRFLSFERFLKKKSFCKLKNQSVPISQKQFSLYKKSKKILISSNKFQISSK